MIEYKCVVCGKVKKTYARTPGLYCSQKCHGIGSRGKPVTPRYQQGNCVFLPEAVICGERNCVNCGWNPVVAKARLEKIMGVHNDQTDSTV